MDYYYMELAEFLSNMVTIHQSNNEACACVPCCGLSGSSQHWSQMVREKDKPLKKVSETFLHSSSCLASKENENLLKRKTMLT